jgi:hypothetical protein
MLAAHARARYAITKVPARALDDLLALVHAPVHATAVVRHVSHARVPVRCMLPSAASAPERAGDGVV